MKKLIVVACFYANILHAQNKDIEAEIRKLEQREVQAVLAKDTITLKTIWDKDYIVNNPENKIVLAQPNSVNRPVLQNQRTSFTRVAEQILVNGDVVISMGNETLVPVGNIADAGQTVKRRYTHIWMKKGERWQLIARHANKICE